MGTQKNERLICRRTQMGFTQLKLAKKLQEMGENCEQAEICKYENGTINPRMSRAKKIAALLQCSVEDIF